MSTALLTMAPQQSNAERDQPITRLDTHSNVVRPMTVYVNYHGVYKGPEYSAAELAQITVSKLGQYYHSAIESVQQPFIIDGRLSMQEVSAALVSYGMPIQLRREIGQILAEDDFHPKFRIIGDETIGKIGVCVSYADRDPRSVDLQSQLGTTVPKKDSSNSNGFGQLS